jgi:hypothetical protein
MGLFVSSSSATELLKLCGTSLSTTSLFSCGGMGTGKISVISGGLTDGGISEVRAGM